MCGITGSWSRGSTADDLATTTARMTRALTHRGPDAAGAWCDPAHGVALGHRRLSILDLSTEGHQPMASPSGRYVAVYNGEIYNFEAIRPELAGVRWRGRSDTEVLLAAIDAWGVRAAVERCAGMFALAVWDRVEARLHLVRDRLGIKPLYYGWCGGTLLFGSELKALRAHPAFAAPIDRAAVGMFLRYDYIPAPATIYAGVRKLAPGSIVTLGSSADRAEPVAYWSAFDAARRGAARPFEGDGEEAADALHALLRGVVGEHMIADVPLGAFLSGGIDSSTVVALMQAQSSRQVKTFAIGFDQAGFDEAPHARAVAGVLGTDHTELYVTPDEARAVIPRLAGMYDEPFADSSQIPTYLVSALARRSVTVALSGDGGDELFGGYARYFASQALWSRLRKIPSPVRRAGARMLRAGAAPTIDRALAPFRGALPRPLRRHASGARAHQVGGLLAARDENELYQQLLTHVEPHLALVGGAAGASYLADRPEWTTLPDYLRRMMLWDATTYLPDDILVKVDRASMAVGLEARVPILDHRVAEFAWSLPPALASDGRTGKLPLRAVLARYVPPALFDRPKMGFTVPLGEWLRGPLREWAGDLLAPDRVRRAGLIEPAVAEQLLGAHLSRRAEHGWALWSLLVLQSWLDEQSAAA